MATPFEGLLSIDRPSLRPWLLLLLLLLVTFPAAAQQVSDPNDGLYTDLKLWEDRGLLNRLPQQRPFPIQYLKTLLTAVQDAGDAEDVRRARSYFERIDGVISLHPLVQLEGRAGDAAMGVFSFGGYFHGSLDPSLSYEGNLQGLVLNGTWESQLPQYQSGRLEYIFDGGLKSFGGTGIFARAFSDSSATLGTDQFYFQAGNMRGSWGPIWGDNAILSPFARQAGQFSYVYRGEAVTITESLFALAATDSSGTSLPMPNKYLALHGMDLYPFPWLTVGLVEAMVWGGRMETLYLLPFNLYFYTQGLAGFYDNSILGFTASARLPHALRWDAILFIDDLSVNDLARLNLNGKTKVSFQTHLGWTAHDPWLEQLSTDLLVVTPYMYTHSDDKQDLPTDPPTPNYLDYTNAGRSLGPSLPPNSVRWEISALSRRLPGADVRLFSRLILHGNSGASYGGTGTVFDNGLGEESYETLHFLDQAVIEKTLQTGFSVDATIPGAGGYTEIELAYTGQLRLDADFQAGATDIRHFFRAQVQFHF